MFNIILGELLDISKNHTHENYILLQRLQTEIQNRNMKGEFDYPHYQALEGLASILRRDLQKSLEREGVLH